MIMRRIYLIWFIRWLRYSLAFRFSVVVFFGWWLGQYMSPWRVIANMQSLHNVGDGYHYLYSSFGQTELEAKILFSLVVFGFFWLMVGGFFRRRLNSF